jgi:hypothetical protein
MTWVLVILTVYTTQGAEPHKYTGRVEAAIHSAYATLDDCQSWVEDPAALSGRTDQRVCVPVLPDGAHNA